MTPEARALMVRNEAVKLTAYQDGGGVWTIGIGHTAGVGPGDTCTLAQAWAWFATDWDACEAAVAAAAHPGSLPRELDAMTSLAYNVGLGAFRGSTVLHRHNAGQSAFAAAAFSMWDLIRGQVSQGLLNRRKREAAFYLGLPWEQLP